MRMAYKESYDYKKRKRDRVRERRELRDQMRKKREYEEEHLKQKKLGEKAEDEG